MTEAANEVGPLLRHVFTMTRSDIDALTQQEFVDHVDWANHHLKRVYRVEG
jgi:lysozyme family protein